LHFPAGLNCNYCEFLATGRSLQLYTSSRDAFNIKKLPVASENANSASYGSSKISGSRGDNTCGTQSGSGTVSCSGDREGVGTFARYGTISGVALQVTVDVAGADVALYVADQGNNKIRRLELTSGLYRMTTFDAGPVDLLGNYLAGIAVSSVSQKLYVGVLGAVYSYDLSIGPSSKSVFSGRQIPGDPVSSKWAM
jgi:hypothetical protein